MIYIIWTIINVALFVAFIFLCLKAVGYLRQRLGLLAAAVVLFVLCSYINHRNESNVSDAVKKWNFISDTKIDHSDIRFTKPQLEETLISTVCLNLMYGKLKSSNKMVPASATSFMTGVTSGHQWRPLVVAINPSDKSGEYQYHVEGLMNWSLLGITVYSQPKVYTGKVMLN